MRTSQCGAASLAVGSAIPALCHGYPLVRSRAAAGRRCGGRANRAVWRHVDRRAVTPPALVLPNHPQNDGLLSGRRRSRRRLWERSGGSWWRVFGGHTRATAARHGFHHGFGLLGAARIARRLRRGACHRQQRREVEPAAQRGTLGYPPVTPPLSSTHGPPGSMRWGSGAGMRHRSRGHGAREA